MRQNDVIAFFARLAPRWDENNRKNSTVIGRILDNAGVGEGKDILDVACGTGVLISDYLERGAASVTAIDITPGMVEIARKKFPQDNVEIICGDAAEEDFGRKFDCIVVYNALPHFPDPEGLIFHLASALKQGGVLTVAHGMSREAINAIHTNAGRVSNDLMSAEELSEIFGRYMTVTASVSDDQMYQVAGRLDKELPAVRKSVTNVNKPSEEGEYIMHDHNHGHEHSHHGYTHEHTHEHITAFESTEQAVRILGYMLDHNKSHAEELHEICHKLELSGEAQAAEYLDKAVDSFRDGNTLMEEALKLLKKEEE